METDEQGSAAPHRRSTQVAGGSEQVLDESRLIGRVLLHVPLHYFGATRRDHEIGIACQGQRVVAAAPVTSRVGLLTDRDFLIRKKLLRPSAGLSTGAVVVPIDFPHGYLELQLAVGSRE